MPRERTVGYMITPKAMAKLKRNLQRLVELRHKCPDPEAQDSIVEEVQKAKPIKEVVPNG
jgi:hypothetical protein